MKPEYFVKKVVYQYNNGQGIFSKKINAEDLIPKDLDDHKRALYIFYVLQLDYAMKSQILYEGAKKLYSVNEDFFTPSYLKDVSNESLTEDLQSYLHPRYINEAVKRFRVNTTALLTLYNGDPRDIFKHVMLAQEVIKRLKDFRGFGSKIGNFFVRTMINTFGYSYPDIDTVLPPVDVHDVRIAYLLGYTFDDRMTQKNINYVKKLWSDACLRSGESWLIFDKALWLLGSEGKPKSKQDVLKLIYN
ncbi:hypothetical protein KBG31_03335 [Patescibacteria group bacterium]|nr:hypothetical protein [Patescibacteria group bacterium]